jgi:pimeloyl-ACP methyl ester carboxylesterase
MFKAALASLVILLSFGASTCSAQSTTRTNIAAEEFFIDSPAPGIKLYVLNKSLKGKKDFSSDKVVLFVHGATYPAEAAFDVDLPNGGSWMNHLAERGYDAYLVDVRGYGKSTRPQSMSVAPDQNAPFATTREAVQDVSAAVDFILKRRNLGKLNLIGWSWGTSIMASYTAQHNANVEKLVLYAPLWIVKSPPPVAGLGAWRSINAENARARGIRGIPEHKVEEISPKAWGEQWWKAVQASDPEGAKMHPPVVRAPNGVVQDITELWAKGKPTYEPADIKVPTMLIVAEWDQDTPLYMAQELFGKLVNTPSKRHVVLGEGTHAVVLEKNRSELFNQVQYFLDEKHKP